MTNTNCSFLISVIIFLLKNFMNTTNGAANQCSDPGVPEHGTRLGNTFKIGGKVYFKCLPEYNLIGSFERYCMANGQWSGDLARCNHVNNYCADPGIPTNGMKNSSIYDMGVKIKFQCMPGYTLIGSEIRECLSNKLWSGIEAKCVGPYDFDNIAQVSDIFISDIEDLKSEQNGIRSDGKRLMGRRLNLNFSGRLILYFAFDVSRSVGRDNFRRTIEFAKAIVSRVRVSDTGNRAGAITFSSDETKFEFVPPDYKTTEEVLMGLDKIEYTRNGLSKYIFSALEVTRKVIIPHTRMELPGKRQKYIIFILTDGKSNLGETFEKEAELLKQDGVEIYCIAMASKVLRNSKYRVISENYINYKEHVFYRLNRAINWLDSKIVDKAKGRLAIYFAFDVSESVNLQNFKDSIKFAKAVVERMESSNIGAITFNLNESKMKFNSNQYRTKEEVLVAFDNIGNTDDEMLGRSALSLIREITKPIVRIPGIDGRSSETGFTYIVIILTDGVTSHAGGTQEEENLLLENGVEIYSIGITSEIPQASLYKIASTNLAGSKNEHFFILQNYDMLSLLAQRITSGTIDYSRCGFEVIYKGGGKIVGGRKAPQPWPWMAALYFKIPGQVDQLGCGGSIIHEKYILTAAHCLVDGRDKISETDVVVKLGLTNVRIETFMEEFTVAKIFIHEKYKVENDYLDYDIALLQLETPIKFNALLRPVCLPPMELPPNSILYQPEQYAIAIGWGHTSVKGMQQVTTTVSDALKEVILPIQSWNRCLQNIRERFERFGLRSEILFTERMFCAGDGRGGNDTCDGDSGGPIMQSQQNIEGRIYWTQIGIVSWGSGCGLRNTYGIYADVKKLYPWIVSVTGMLIS